MHGICSMGSGSAAWGLQHGVRIWRLEAAARASSPRQPAAASAQRHARGRGLACQRGMSCACCAHGSIAQQGRATAATRIKFWPAPRSSHWRVAPMPSHHPPGACLSHRVLGLLQHIGAPCVPDLQSRQRKERIKPCSGIRPPTTKETKKGSAWLCGLREPRGGGLQSPERHAADVDTRAAAHGAPVSQSIRACSFEGCWPPAAAVALHLWYAPAPAPAPAPPAGVRTCAMRSSTVRKLGRPGMFWGGK